VSVRYGMADPCAGMGSQDVREPADFFERRVSACRMAVEGNVTSDESF